VVLVTYRDAAESLPAHGLPRVVADRGDRRVVAARCLEAFTPHRARWAEDLFARIAPDAILFPQQSIFPRRVAAPCVLTVHDLQHLFFPHYFTRFDRAFRAAVYPASLRGADRIIAISNFTRCTLLEHGGVPADRVVTVPHGFAPAPVTPAAAAAGDAAAPLPAGPFLYYPASTHPHKNHATLLTTLAELRRRGTLEYRLVLSGVRTKHWPQLARQIQQLGLGDVVQFTGLLPYSRVAQYYDAAAAVVIPSQFEGFGLPVLEAVAHGKKVIVSDLEVFRELGVPAAWRIDFGDPDQLLRALRQPGTTRLARSPSTWQDCARATLEVLRSAARSPAAAPK
jgi:glycosyltransferase involved in cell wall biosynthesis